MLLLIPFLVIGLSKYTFTHSVYMAGYLFKLLFVFDIILGNVLISQLPLTWACCLVSDSCAREGLVSAGFRVGSTGFRWFRPVSGRFGWFRVILLFSNYAISVFSCVDTSLVSSDTFSLGGSTSLIPFISRQFLLDYCSSSSVFLSKFEIVSFMQMFSLLGGVPPSNVMCPAFLILVAFMLCTLSAKAVTYYRTLFYRLEKSHLHYEFISR